MKYSTFSKSFAYSLAAIAMSFGTAGIASAEVPSWCGPKQATLALLDG
jgi:ribose transport system substrate-binding protein